ncbi:unnamed protein product, partial [Coregonus sp. 'balchen']
WIYLNSGDSYLVSRSIPGVLSGEASVFSFLEPHSYFTTFARISWSESCRFTMAGAGIFLCILLLQCFISTALCNAGFAFTEEPSERAGKSDGYCSRILRAQGTRKEGYNEFRLRVEGDPENYQPGSTYR